MEHKTNGKKRLLKIILVIGVIYIGIVAIRSIYEYQQKKGLYSSTISMIENGNYKWAQSYAFNYWSAYDDESLLMLVNVLEFDSELDQLIRTDKLDKYKLKKFKKELAFFTDEYSGYMSEYILDLKSREKEITRKCEEYFESVEKAKQAEEEKRLKKLKVNPPYEGLSENDIDNTSWGKHIYAEKVSLYTYSDALKKHGVTCSDANGRIYTFSGTHYRYVLCGGGRVLIASLEKIRSNQYYANYIPSNDDEYNASNYSNAEDFYDDNYDYFWDYYEAENYYDEHSE